MMVRSNDGDVLCVLLHTAPVLWVSQYRLNQFP